MMTTQEAIAWCHANRANLLFNKNHVVAEVGSPTSGIERATAATVEEAVSLLTARLRGEPAMRRSAGRPRKITVGPQ